MITRFTEDGTIGKSHDVGWVGLKLSPPPTHTGNEVKDQVSHAYCAFLLAYLVHIGYLPRIYATHTIQVEPKTS